MYGCISTEKEESMEKKKKKSKNPFNGYLENRYQTNLEGRLE